MSRGRGLAGSSLLMFSGTLVSRVLGMVRDPLLLGAAIGVNYGAANAFAVANRLPNMIHLLLAGGVLNAVLVPQIVRAMKSPGDGGETYVNRMLTVFGSLLAVITVLLTAGAPVLVRVYGSALPQEWLELAVVFAIWTVPQVFFYGLYTVLGQVLNARGDFGPYMWAPAVNNVVAIAGLALYLVLFGPVRAGPADDAGVWDAGRIALLAGSATLGVAAQAVILLWPLRRSGYHYRWDFTWRGSGLGRASRVAMWTFGSVVVGQVVNIVVVNVAAVAFARGDGDLGVPGPAAYNPAYTIFILVNSLVVISIITALFTRMSANAASGRLTQVRDDLSLGLRVVGLFTVFATGALMVLALPVARVVAATVSYPEAQSIARVAAAFLSGVVGMGALTVVQRVYYAFEDTRRLFLIQSPFALIVAVGALVSLLLPPQWTLVGVGVATTVSNTLAAGVLFLALRTHLPSLDGGRVVRAHLRLGLAVLPAVAVGWGLLHLTGLGRDELSAVGALWRTIVVGAVMALLYAAALWRLRIPELAVVGRPAGGILADVGARVPGPVGGALRRWGARLAGHRTLGDDGPGAGAQGGSTGSGTLDAAGESAGAAQGGVLGDRYELRDRLGCADAGVGWWAAHDLVLDRPVQLLLLDRQEPRTPDVLDAARRAAVLEDPRIVPILDVVDEAGAGYVVTAAFAGQSLDRIAAEHPLPPEQARAVVGEVARALETAHRAGVMHLAVRPEAVRVTASDAVLLTGLGVDADGDDTDPVARFRRAAVDLVRLLYLGLTGHWPGEHPSLPSAPVDDDGAPLAPSTLRAEVPDDLDDLCRTTLAGGPEAVTSPAELVRALEPWEKLDHRAMPVTVPDRHRQPAPPAAQLAAARPAPAPAVASAPPVGRDASGWTPRALSADDPTGAPDFDLLLSAAGTPAAPARHQAETGAAAALAAASAFTGGLAERTRELAAQAGAQLRALVGAAGRLTRRVAATVRARSAGRTVERAAQGAAADPAARTDSDPVAPPPATSSPPAPGQGAPGSRRPFRPVRGEGDRTPRDLPQDARLTDRRVDPTPWALGFAAVGLVVLVILSIRGLSQPVEEVSLPDPTPTASVGAAPSPTPEPSPPAPAADPPRIAALTILDPQGDGAEFPELTPRALDGDPGTYWRSRRYNDPEYGMKDGIGLAVTLDRTAQVSAVELDVMGSGGLVEVRATSPTAPTNGPVLASGEMSAQTVLPLAEPVETDMLVLWFPRLPTSASDGLPRIELAEIRVR